MPRIRFTGCYSSWQDALKDSCGYDSDYILKNVLVSTLKVVNGQAACERDSVAFDEPQYSWPVTAALMSASAICGAPLSVLDFGGSLGSTYFQNQKFLSLLPHYSWSIVEQKNFAKAGNQYIHSDGLFFYDNLAECIIERSPNVILLSGVLQCLEFPFALLDELLAHRPVMVVLDRTPYLKKSSKSTIRVQRVPRSICKSSYPIHFFLESDILCFFKQLGYTLLESFCSLDDLHPSAQWKGHIFQRSPV